MVKQGTNSNSRNAAYSGVQHEHQRGDSDKSIKPSAKATNQAKANKHAISISRFDPYSIMIYRERDGTYTCDDRDPVWKLKPDTDMNMRMSELDKVGLNLLYRPCEECCIVVER